MLLDQAREADNRRRLRLDLMTERINLSLAQIGLRQAEAEFERVQHLFEKNLVPQGLNQAGDGAGGRFDFGYDVALRDRDVLRAEVDQRLHLVAELEAELAATSPTPMRRAVPTSPTRPLRTRSAPSRQPWRKSSSPSSSGPR
jgi:multidrug resistance efflux pump